MNTVEFLEHHGLLVDVRSPSEFAQGHICGAINIPLFSDAERAKVGTCYKQEGPQEAIALGMRLVGPKMGELFADLLAQKKEHTTIKVYCWRGGMRSLSVVQMCQSLKVPALQLQGGYKAFRRHALSLFEREWPLYVLSGPTGTGKTHILHELEKCGEAVVDIEALAKHKGSAFGNIGHSLQPTCEQFENDLSMALFHKRHMRRIFVEDESRPLGLCRIPQALFATLTRAPAFVIERSFQERKEILLADYEKLPLETFETCLQKIQKRLGLERFLTILAAAKESNCDGVLQGLFSYYDKSYSRATLMRREIPLDARQKSAHSCAVTILDFLSQTPYTQGHGCTP